MVTALVLALLASGDGRSEFEAATRALREGHVDEACALFELARERSAGRPSTLRALAQCERQRRRYARAIELFRAYLATRPPDAAAIEATLRELERGFGPELVLPLEPTRESTATAVMPPASLELDEPLEPASAPPPEEGRAWIWWVGAGVLVLGGAAAIAAAAASGDPPEPSGGTLGVVLR